MRVVALGGVPTYITEHFAQKGVTVKTADIRCNGDNQRLFDPQEHDFCLVSLNQPIKKALVMAERCVGHGIPVAVLRYQETRALWPNQETDFLRRGVCYLFPEGTCKDVILMTFNNFYQHLRRPAYA